MRDPLTEIDRKRFEKEIIHKWRGEYAKALACGAFDARKFGKAGNSTVAKAALQRVFCEVLKIADVLAALRSY